MHGAANGDNTDAIIMHYYSFDLLVSYCKGKDKKTMRTKDL